MLKKCLITLCILLFSFGFTQQTGKASYYGSQHHGKKTASGKVFNMDSLTCASNIHPLGSKLKVTNLENNLSVIVEVTDRGGFSKMGRILDLSRGAFAKIADVRKGLVRVLVEKVTN